jgi:hypothetical protein
MVDRLSWLVACAVVCTANVACTEVGGEAFAKAMTAEDGISEQRLIELAGPATRRLSPSEECRARGGTHSLAYESRIQRLGGWMGSDLSAQVVVCIDRERKVVAKNVYQY